LAEFGRKAKIEPKIPTASMADVAQFTFPRP
jgi:hypothetical protein